MSNSTTIEWTDATWNPVTGCTKVSPGCDHCYAETIAERFRGTEGHYYEHGFDVQLRPAKLDQPLRWRKPRRIFVNSMSDLFHDAVPDEYIARVFAVMAAAPQHTFQILTKRHGRMRSLLSSTEFAIAVADAWSALDTRAGQLDDDHTPPYPLPNVWGLVSAEDQKRAELRIPALLETPFAVRGVSLEPLLGPIDLGSLCALPPTEYPRRANYLDWVIVGGESGRRARPMRPEWVRGLRDQCWDADVPFLFKQWGGRTPKAGGRELDGHTYDQYPDEVPHV